MLFELKENMQVIRHNHEAVDLVALVIEMMQGVGDDLLWLWFTQTAGAVTVIKEVF